MLFLSRLWSSFLIFDIVKTSMNKIQSFRLFVMKIINEMNKGIFFWQNRKKH